MKAMTNFLTALSVAVFLACVDYASIRFTSPQWASDVLHGKSAVSAAVTDTESAVNVSPVHITERRRKYIERFAHVAQVEEAKYGIPASITLAQGILESRDGLSGLALRGKNHFGVKCKPDIGGKCGNFRHKDGTLGFYKMYASAWESYRDHSELLSGDRYAAVRACGDYKCWAKQLRKCGYARDPDYPKKLISIIERADLARFDCEE